MTALSVDVPKVGDWISIKMLPETYVTVTAVLEDGLIVELPSQYIRVERGTSSYIESIFQPIL